VFRESLKSCSLILLIRGDFFNYYMHSICNSLLMNSNIGLHPKFESMMKQRAKQPIYEASRSVLNKKQKKKAESDQYLLLVP
jgi:hypothetical protein